MKETYENSVELVGVFTDDPIPLQAAVPVDPGGEPGKPISCEAILKVQRKSGTVDRFPVRFSTDWIGTKLTGKRCYISGQIGSENHFVDGIRYACPYILARYVAHAGTGNAEDLNLINLDGYIIGRPKTRQPNGRELCNRQIVNNNLNIHGSYISVTFWDDLASQAVQLKPGTYIRITGQLREHLIPSQNRQATEICCRVLTVGKEETH